MDKQRCENIGLVGPYAMHALAASERPAFETHMASCPHCRWELEVLRPVVASFAGWPADVLRPLPSLQARLASRIAARLGGELVVPPASQWADPEWKAVAPGIECKILARDDATGMVSMLVRLAPGGEYPAHTHAGVEELHLLHGELWIDDRKLFPGDYNRAEPGTGDKRVWSETGCTCVLVTSTRDILR